MRLDTVASVQEAFSFSDTHEFFYASLSWMHRIPLEMNT